MRFGKHQLGQRIAHYETAGVGRVQNFVPEIRTIQKKFFQGHAELFSDVVLYLSQQNEHHFFALDVISGYEYREWVRADDLLAGLHVQSQLDLRTVGHRLCIPVQIEPRRCEVFILGSRIK